MKFWPIAIAVVSVVLVPGIAVACPVCAGNELGTPGQTVAFLAMLALPFVVATVVYRAIRRAIDKERPL